MPVISDEYMRQVVSTAREYCVCILLKTPKRQDPGVEPIVWEHARRNFSLRADGILSIVCPVSDSSGVSGIYIFNADAGKVDELMRADPAVRAGIFTYEIHPCRGFPGDQLPP